MVQTLLISYDQIRSEMNNYGLAAFFPDYCLLGKRKQVEVVLYT